MLNNSEQFWQHFNNATSLAIIANREPWGDSLATALAIKLIASKLGKRAEVYAWQSPVESHSFLSGSEDLKGELDENREFIISLSTETTKVNKVKYKLHPGRIDFIIEPENGFFQESDIKVRGGSYNHDLIITINVQDLDSLGELYKQNTAFFYSTPVINIDNQAGNENYGQINLINLNATSSAEIIYTLLEDNRPGLIDPDLATCLLTGIISRTKSFKTDNVTPQSLMITADLIQHGADRDTIIANLYRNRNINTIKLWGRLLSNLKSLVDERILFAVLEQSDVDNINDSDISQIIDELIIQIPETQVVIIFLDRGTSLTLLAASPKNINCQSLIKEYSPYGSKRIAWAEIAKPLEEIQTEILDLVTQKLSKLN